MPAAETGSLVKNRRVENRDHLRTGARRRRDVCRHVQHVDVGSDRFSGQLKVRPQDIPVERLDAAG